MKRYLGLIVRASFLIVYVLSFVFPTQSASATPGDISIQPNSWNVIGLDSNSPTDGPFRFPIGAKVCNNTASPISGVIVNFVWEDNATTDPFWNDPNAHDFINLRDGSLDSITLPTIAANSCEDAFFEVEVLQDSSAFNETRGYYIEAINGSDPAITTPRPRELFVEFLISQNRNSVTDVLLGSTSVPPGGTMYLMEGQTYFITLKGGTATQGYNQFEDFINFPNTIFQILSVKTTYSADSNVPPLSSPYPYLYADSCGWDNDPNSPTYRSCIESDEKAGGSNVETVYEIKILSNTAGQSGNLNTLLYDFSGSSYHYNADFSFGVRSFEILGPESVDITKTFSPKAISPGGTSVLTFKITNPTPATITGANFIDDFTDAPMPAGLTVHTTPGVSTPGCGTGTLTKVGGGALTGGETAVSFSGGTILPNSTCTINVTVTSAVANTYPNTTRHLFIDINGSNTDTGNFDDDTLKVASTPACTPGQTLVTWTFPDGVTVPDPAEDSKAANVATASLSYTGDANGTETISTNDSGASATSNSWSGDGFNKDVVSGSTTTPYFQVAVDTSRYSNVKISLRTYATANWNQNNIIKVWTSTDGTNFNASPTGTGTLTKSTWSAAQVFDAFATGTSTTYFRINADGATNTDGEVLLDNIVVTGCAEPTPPPTITKSFGTDPIKVGDTSKLTITVTNTSSTQSLTDVGFTDPLPAGIGIKEPVDLTGTTCTLANVSTNTLTDTIVLDTQTLSASGSCSVVIDVVGTASGQLNNVTGYVSVSNVDTNNYAEDPITVWAPPVIAKSFAPTSIFRTETSVLTFTITNPNTFDALTGVGFSDNLPAGVDVTSVTTNACGGINNLVITDNAPAVDTIVLTGGTIAANSTCTINVTVTGSTIGTKPNTTSVVTSTEGGNGNTASASLLVQDKNPGLSLTKQISKVGSTGPWSNFVSVLPGSNIWYRFVVYNSGDVTLSAINVTDPPAGGTVTCSWTDESNNPLSAPWTLAPGATAYCVIADTADTTPDSYPNTAQAYGTYLAADDVDSNQSTAIYAIPELVLDKSADRTIFSAAGETINYTFVVTNKNNGYDAPIPGPVTISDPLIAGASCPALTAGGAGDNDDDDNFLEPGESITCTGSYVTLLTPDVDTNKEVVNTAAASAGGITSNQDSVTVELANPELTLTKSITAGDPYDAVNDVISYQFVVENTGNVPLTGPVTVADDKSTDESCPNVNTVGNLDGELDPGESITCTASYTVVQADLNAGSVTNNASASADGTTSNTDTETATATLASIGIDKTVSSSPVATGNPNEYTITYQVRVINSGTGAGTYALTDTPTFDSDATIVSASFTKNGGASTSLALPAPWTLASAGTNIAASTTDTYLVTVVFTVPAGSNMSNNACGTSLTPGNGLYNQATVTPGTGSAASDDACSDTPGVFDPPAAFKTFNADGLPVIEFRMVWINNSNSAAINVQVTDVIPTGTTYVPGSITCTPTNTGPAITPSSTAGSADAPLNTNAAQVIPSTSCGYDSAANGIQWQGTIAPDPGVANDANAEANANHEVVITFQVTVDANVNQVSNVGNSRTDTNNDGTFDEPSSPSVIVPSNLVVWNRTGGGTPAVVEDPVELPKTLPNTGFAPNKVTIVPDQPEALAYRATDVWLEVPRLGLKMPIVGVPLAEGDWNLSWLWDEAGWLEGSAFPTWQGNSVLTGHVTLPNGETGPFASLGKLKWGDRVLVHAYGTVYIYEVRQNRTVSPTNTSVLQHEEDPWITLLTCKTYNESTGLYENRTAVRAVLIGTMKEKTTSGKNAR